MMIMAQHLSVCRVCASLGGCVYDVAADPYEERNLALVRPSLMAELQAPMPLKPMKPSDAVI